jgi:signal transduction histidine kinase
VEPEPTELGPIVEETVAEFRMMIHEHQFRVKLPHTLPKVLADPRRMRQVLRNLVENAVKYSPGGGKIIVSVQIKDDHGQVSVSDEGIGIEPGDLDRVFDRFYQVDSASTRKVGGSGLGLSICQAIVKAHKGRIWVESRPGEGSTFHFTLPLASPSTLR